MCVCVCVSPHRPQAKGSAAAEGVRAFVVGGERSTAAERAELVELLDGWVGVHGRCQLERGWRLDVDGGMPH